MKKITSEKKFIQALQGKVFDIPPIWFMRQAGRYLSEYKIVRKQAGSFLNLCYSPELACEVTLQPIRKFGFDASILFADILLIPDALGQDLDYKEGEGPVLAPIRDESDFLKLDSSDIHKKLEPVYETVSLLSQRLPVETALIGFCGAPWTVATYMVGGRGGIEARELTKNIGLEHVWFDDLINLLTDCSIEYLSRQIDAGAEAVQIFDSWAGDLNRQEFERWTIKPTTRIVSALKKKYPDVPIIGFPRRAKEKTIDYIYETKIDAVSLDTDVSLDWACQKIQTLCPVQGCLDPDILIRGGEELEREVHKLLDIFTKGPYVFNLGHGIKPETPPDHVQHVIDIIRNRKIGS